MTSLTGWPVRLLSDSAFFLSCELNINFVYEHQGNIGTVSPQPAGVYRAASRASWGTTRIWWYRTVAQTEKHYVRFVSISLFIRCSRISNHEIRHHCSSRVKLWSNLPDISVPFLLFYFRKHDLRLFLSLIICKPLKKSFGFQAVSQMGEATWCRPTRALQVSLWNRHWLEIILKWTVSTLNINLQDHVSLTSFQRPWPPFPARSHNSFIISFI